MPKIFVSTYPFGVSDSTPRKILEKTGWDIQYNSFQRKLKPEEVADLAKDSDGIIAATENLSLLIETNSKLRFISRVGIGLDSVPLGKCKEKGIRISYTPDAVTPAVAELTIGLMISLSRYVNLADREIRRENWTRPVGKRIQNSKIGIIGFGRVGKSVTKLLSIFRPESILVNDLTGNSNEIETFGKNLNLSIKEVTKEEIYTSADIISLHLPLYSKTKQMIDGDVLKLFSKESFLINTARGELINEEDLFEALVSNKIKGAALDVFEIEPYKGRLKTLENVLLTQHIGSCSYDCRYQMELQATEEIIRFFENKPLVREVPEEEYIYQL